MELHDRARRALGKCGQYRCSCFTMGRPKRLCINGICEDAVDEIIKEMGEVSEESFVNGQNNILESLE